MITMRAGLILVLSVLGAGVLDGCSQDSEPSSIAKPTQYIATSRFSFTYNGQVFDRASDLTETSGYAYTKKQGFYQRLSIVMRYNPLITLQSMEIDLSLAMPSITPTTYTIADTSSSSSRMYFNDTQAYVARTGHITITSVDSVASTVSGTFDFYAMVPSDTTKHVLVEHGTFTGIPIYAGCFSQGTVSAQVGRGSFFSGQGPADQSVEAFAMSGQNVVYIVAYSASRTQELILSITAPRLGTNNLTSSTELAYQSGYLGPEGQIGGDAGARGTVNLTVFDEKRHLISGTFTLSGPDENTGKQLSITQGVIDSVRWFVL